MSFAVLDKETFIFILLRNGGFYSNEYPNVPSKLARKSLKFSLQSLVCIGFVEGESHLL